MEKVERICSIIIWPLSKVVPVTSCPEVALVLVFVIIYFMCEFILTVMNVFSVYTGMSHFLVGLTLMVWGSDVLELFNMIISVRKHQVELGMSSVLGCQVLCLLVIVPLACYMRMVMRDQTEIQILQAHHTRN
jgi:Ca2+/Na+ antiporter